MGTKKTNGCYIYPIKKDGYRYSKPLFVAYVGFESTPEEVVDRLSSLNPGHSYEFDV